jgi:S-adenosylmethionine-diacylglycerol 3-amino-3-carboxypropyl transferase
MSYFNELNYSLANEDSRLELHLVQQIRPAKILSICGSGGRFLPLAASFPAKIVALDIAPQQLALAELRAQTMRQLDFEDYCRFWGFPPYHPQQHHEWRRQLFPSLRLSDATQAYFQKLFEIQKWQGLIYAGKWEQTITGTNRLLRKIVGGRYDEIFGFRTMEEQRNYFDRVLKNFWWKLFPRLVLLLVGNATFFNALLYRGHFVKKNIPENTFSFYRKVYRRLFYNGLTRENFFLQLSFLGELRFPEGNPIEAQPEVYAAMREALLQERVQIEHQRADFIAYTRTCQEKFDFVSLSDVPSYFAGSAERNYLQELSRCLNPGAIVVVRCYLRIPENCDTNGYEDVSSHYDTLIMSEKMQVYRIYIYRYKG